MAWRAGTGMGLVAAMALAGSAGAQSFNIDFDVALAGTWAGAPADAFGGAADQPGHWVAAGIGASTLNMRDITSTATAVDLAVVNLASGYNFDNASISGDFDRLLGDGMNSTNNLAMTFTFSSLRPGVYSIYTYACDPFAADPCTVSVLGALEGVQGVAGNPTSNAFAEGTTHVVHNFIVGAAGTIQITALDAGGSARVGGIQLRYRGAVQPRLYVDASATGNNSGASWTNALLRLEDAIQAAHVNAAITEVWVANGTYRPTIAIDRTATYRLKSGLAIYGGFAGGEVALSQRNPAVNTTTLSGDIGMPRDNTENVYHVVRADNTDTTAILDGFRITAGNGNGNGGVVPFSSGAGGLWIHTASPRIRNCVFIGNDAFEGGAVSFWAAPSTARFVNCDFRDNQCNSFGGGVYYRGNNGSDVQFINCRFLRNSAGTLGGGAYCLNGSGPVTFTNCLFSGNSTNFGGGAIYTFGSFLNLNMRNCTVTNNTSATCGGVLLTSGSNGTIYNSIFWGNTDTDAMTNLQGANISTNAGAPSGTVSFTYCDIQGLDGTLGGSGMIGVDPMFVDANGADNIVGTIDDNVRLRPNSPCIDAGRNNALPADVADLDGDGNVAETLPFDLLNRLRRLDHPDVADTGSGTAPIVDMGAIETVPCLADVDDGSGTGTPDGGVTIDDLLYYLFLFENGFIDADVDDGSFTGTPDGGVTIDDLLYYLFRFENGC